MSAAIDVLAAAVVNPDGIVGSGGVRARWGELGASIDQVRVPWKALFGDNFRDFRRLDPWSRLICLGVEAAAPGGLLDEATRRRTAILGGTTAGCLVADLRFMAGLSPEAVAVPHVFPYTLPSTGLGEAAIRHGLQGPVVCLSIEPGRERVVLEEAACMLGDGGCDAALVCVGDAVTPAAAQAVGVEPRVLLTVLLLEARAPRSEREPRSPCERRASSLREGAALDTLECLLEADDLYAHVERRLLARGGP